MNFGILRLYCGKSGTKGFYNMQELGLAKSVARLNYIVYIFILDNNLKKYAIEDYNDKIHFVYLPSKSINNHGVFNLKYLKLFNLDILQIASDNQIYAPNVIRFCKKNKIDFYNYIGTIESDSRNILKKKLMNFLFMRNLRCYKSCVNYAKTPYVKNMLENYGVGEIKLMPVGLDTDNINVSSSHSEIIKKYDLDIDKKYIIFVGRLENYKNPLLLTKLFTKIKKSYNFIIVGTGSLKEDLLESLKENNLSDRVRYIEKVPNDQIHELYSISDFFINLNKNEIFGMSILEAIYNGCTVVAFHAPGPDFIIKKNIGYLCDDIYEMIDIINNDKFVNKDKLKNYIYSEFNWNKNAEMIISRYRER